MIYDNVLKEASSQGISCRIKEKIFSDEYKDYEVIKSAYSDEGVLELTVAIPMRDFSMPNLNYKNQDIAVQLLKNIGIEGKVEIDYNDAIAENLVYAQDIKKGKTVNPNTSAVLQVSRGGRPFTMPYIIGITSADAEKQLSDLKLAVKIEYGYSSEYKEGEVYQQSIAAGSDVRKGDEIVVHVCSLDSLIKVENIVGKDQNDAKNLLEGQKLKVQISEAYSETVEKGRIIRQLPEAGTMQEEGTVIVLTVSKGSQRPEEPSGGGNGATDNMQGQPAGTWSSWVSSLPGGVSSKNYDIEQMVEYRSRKRETTASTQANLAGWTLYDQTEAWSDYGSWSEWSTEKKAASDSTKVLSKTQYSTRTRSATTSNTSSSMSGWDLYKTDESWSDYESWSSWSEQPVSSDDYTKVESKKQYRYQDKATTTSTTSDSMSGWTLYDTKYEWGLYGNWTSWSTTQPSSSESTKVESKTQYRYRDKLTTTDTSSSKPGWTLYDTKEEWGPYGSWSDWSDTKPTENESTKVESTTAYRYRDKETRTSSNSYLDGWTQTGSSSSYSNWSSWSDWGSPLPFGNTSSSDTYQVESRTVYTWSWFKCENCGSYEPTTKCRNCNYYPESTVIGSAKYNPTSYSNATGSYGGYGYIIIDGHKAYDVDRYTKTEYRYRTRTLANTYTYERWGDWSQYQNDPVSSSSTREVQTKTVYRYATRSRVKTYYYYKWDNWSSWQDSSVSANSSREVETQTVYRSASREKVKTNYFYKWGSWSGWDDTSYTQSSTRNVETRTVYRSCKRTKLYTYYFEKWSAWSEWGDISYTVTDNRDVRTRTVYSYANRTKQYTYYYEKWGAWSNYVSDPIPSADNVDVQTRVRYRYRKKAG